MRKTIIPILTLIALCGGAITSTSYFTESDKEYSKKILLNSFLSSDVASVHYGVVGLKRLGETTPASASQCKLLVDVGSDTKASAETLYHVVIAHKTIGNCQQALPVINIVKSLNAIIAKESNLQELFHATYALVALGQKPTDTGKLIKAAQALLKKNDSLSNFGYFFHISAALGTEAATAAFDRIEDALVQADEIDSKFLQFEGGLSTTALIINGVFKIANIVNKAPAITNEQAVKFANYFLSRRSVQTPKGVANLIQALINLSTNKFQIPVAISLASTAKLSTDQPKVSIKVSDVMGKDLGTVSLTADSATRVPGDVVVLSKEKFTPSSDKTVFTLDLLKWRPERGQYRITVSAAVDRPDPRFPSPVTSTITAHVLTTAVIDVLDIGTVDADQTTQGKLTRIQYPKTADKVIEGDSQQKIQMRFNIKDKTSSKLMTVHQAFLRFYKPGTEENVIFIAEPDSNGQYRLDLDLGLKSGDFGHVSGEYEVELIIGDAILVNSFSWKIARVNLKFNTEPKTKSDQDIYKPKPEIKHLFREPERRPARFVSDLFSIFVALPLLILLVLWAKLGINVSNLSLSLWTLLFHLGLAGIFVLFGLFWLRLNMFETVRYLLGIGLVTFFSGNKLLRGIASSKK